MLHYYGTLSSQLFQFASVITYGSKGIKVEDYSSHVCEASHLHNPLLPPETQRHQIPPLLTLTPSSIFLFWQNEKMK